MAILLLSLPGNKPALGYVTVHLELPCFAAALVYNIFQEDNQDTVSSAIKCHGFHAHNEDEELRRRLAKLENQVEKLASVLKTQHNVQQTTGQGEAIFSWDKKVNRLFPRRC